MKTIFTSFLLLLLLTGACYAQDSGSKSKKNKSASDTSVTAYQIIPKGGSGDPFVLTMPAGSLRSRPVKMPNAYRRNIIVRPVPMPTHRVDSLGTRLR